MIKLMVGAALAPLLVGCVSTEVATFTPAADQQSIIRDGNPALISKKPGSIVMVRPAAREFQAGQRPAFVVAVFNAGKAPENFLIHRVSAAQSIAGEQPYPLKVYTYEELVAEEKRDQTNRAILAALVVGANAAAASSAGYYSASGTVSTPYGVSHVRVSGYDPSAAAVANANAAAANADVISNVVETGQRNLASLEQVAMKDNTIMPGEWYGGRVVLNAPKVQPEGKAKIYRITVTYGADIHEIDVAQSAVKS